MSKSRVRDRESKPLVVLGTIILIVMLFLSIGLLRANVKPQVWRSPLPPTPQPESEETSLTDQLYNTLIKPITNALGLTSEDTGSEPVGLDVQVGYTGTSGESIVYSENVLSGVGLLTHSGIFVKPSLGKYKALKLYDAQRGLEGEIWVKPIIRIRVFNGTPEEWSFHLKTKVVADEDIIDIKSLDKSGKGIPPKRIEFEKVSVKGSTLHRILRGEVRSLGRLQSVPLQAPSGSRKICFYADYQGMMKFKGDQGDRRLRDGDGTKCDSETVGGGHGGRGFRDGGDVADGQDGQGHRVGPIHHLFNEIFDDEAHREDLDP